jgi:hypothetical protein
MIVPQVPGCGRADLDVQELERMYTLEKPVLTFRQRAHNLLLAFLACAAIMGLAALFIVEASK